MRAAHGEWKDRVAAATVRLEDKGGQGVLVAGGFILTATHCIEWAGDGEMAVGDWFVQAIVTKSGARFRLGVDAADPVSDLAVLGALDGQEFPDDEDTFCEWCAATEPVPVSDRILSVGESTRVHVLAHTGEWIAGKVTRFGLPGSLPGARVSLQPENPIKPGTSGGPVMDDEGRLVGVISWTGEPMKNDDVWGMMGMIPLACLAVPRWVWSRIGGGQPLQRLTSLHPGRLRAARPPRLARRRARRR